MDYTVRERYTLERGLRWFMVDYQDDRDCPVSSIATITTIAGTAVLSSLPKTSVLGEVAYNIVRHDEPAIAADRDSDAWRFLVGVKGDITRQDERPHHGWLGVWRTHENARRRTGTGSSPKASIVWKYREPSEIRLYGGRANVESLEEYAELLHQQLRGCRGPAFPQRAADPPSPGARRCANDYPENYECRGHRSARRKDNFFEAGASIKYQMRRWLAFELGYNF